MASLTKCPDYLTAFARNVPYGTAGQSRDPQYMTPHLLGQVPFVVRQRVICG